MATIAQKVGPKFQVTIPKKVRDAFGIQVGDFVEASVGREGILLKRKILIDHNPVVEAALKEALADIKAGRVSKSYKSARTLIRDAVRHGHELSKNKPIR
ncbi:MAG: AbrB/MazE/SpoVT family DNA-binding domain-containing protein [Patescibacteria group bacterium]